MRATETRVCASSPLLAVAVAVDPERNVGRSEVWEGVGGGCEVLTAGAVTQTRLGGRAQFAATAPCARVTVQRNTLGK